MPFWLLLLLLLVVVYIGGGIFSAHLYTFPHLPGLLFSLDQVSVMGHSLGSIITHDILMAQPVKGQTGLAEGAVSQDIPVLRYAMIVCRATGLCAVHAFAKLHRC